MTRKNLLYLNSSATIAFGFALMMIAFNNCGQSRSNQDLAYHGLNYVQEEFAKSASAMYSSDICGDAEKYSCMQRSFSSNLENGQKPANFPCVNVGYSLEICPSGTVYTFDSSAGIAGCDNCNPQQIAERYEFDEFICFHSGIKTDNIYPIRADGRDYENTLRSVYSVCQQLLGSQ